MSESRVTIVGGGLAGLVAAIVCADQGRKVVLYEAHGQLGGRARSSRGPFVANLGPHAIYTGGPLWNWLRANDLLPAVVGPHKTGLRFRVDGEARRTPPAVMLKALRHRHAEAPVDEEFRVWATGLMGEEAARLLSAAAGVFTFDADPGRLSAAFVWERLKRVTSLPPGARFVVGGWSTMVAALEERARSLGVALETGVFVDQLPETPVIVATELGAARRLLGDDSLRWTGARTALLDVGLERRRGDAYIVSDLDEAGWVERFTASDPSLAPDGHELLQAQLGTLPGEALENAVARAERLLDAGFRGWRQRGVWRRRSIVECRSGALDLPGTTWRDRPAIDRGGGVFLAGDMVAAPGMLGEVSVASALEATRLLLGGVRREVGSERRLVAG